MNRTTIIWTTAALALAACDAPERNNADDRAALDTQATASPSTDGPALATATLRTIDGREAGRARLTPANGGLGVEVHATGLEPGEHGIHVHMIGECDAASAFESAGEHLNPTNAQHGLENELGAHAGDLPNLAASADSAGHLVHPSPLLSDSTLFDADGAALVIHAMPDDQRTDPSGNSGGRVACGVIERG
jgi:Cu-Zn family superoxide dismutase